MPFWQAIWSGLACCNTAWRSWPDLLFTHLLKATEAKHIHARLAGAVVAGVGTFLTLENIEGLVFNILGLAV